MSLPGGRPASLPESLVGIIANPSAGKDIRRLVAHGRVVPNQEKVSVIRRVLLALDALGVERALIMPDPSTLGRRALDGADLEIDAGMLEMPVDGGEEDSTRAAALMAEMGAGCIVTLGGDGTNRVVPRGCGTAPLVPISTGTNNVFPAMVEGTTAGLAAGLVARGLVDGALVCHAQKRLDVYVDGEPEDIALVDVAVSRERFVASRAIWDVATIDELFLTCAEPSAIGLSSIGAQLHPLAKSDEGGLHLRLGPGGTQVLAAVAPGTVQPVPVAEWRLLAAGERVEVRRRSGTIALDGERQFSALPGRRIEVAVSAEGPLVVAIDAALRQAAERGVFRDYERPSTRSGSP